MNLKKAGGLLRALTFRVARAAIRVVPGGRIGAFGDEPGKIGAILVVNLDRQPRRLRRTMRELLRFRTHDGRPLTSLAGRMRAIDARNGRDVAATADVDPLYRLGDQMFVQPDAALADCFGPDERVTMTRQEVAVGRSHVEAWKGIAEGSSEHVLIVEDDIWLMPGAAAAIDAGWKAAWRRCNPGGPNLLYLSYSDAGGTATRMDVCEALFRPERGLWFLSGYILSRQGARLLLRAMPVNGPVDMWMNYRFAELGALALSAPAIGQRPDGASDNSYSVLPYLARAGIVDADAVEVPRRGATDGMLAWTARGERDGLAMALSILGLRVRTFAGEEPPIDAHELRTLLETWDALVDPPLSRSAWDRIRRSRRVKVLFEPEAPVEAGWRALGGRPSDPNVLTGSRWDGTSWRPLCDFLGVDEPAESFPHGPLRAWRTFHDERGAKGPGGGRAGSGGAIDDSPWVVPLSGDWPAAPCGIRSLQPVESPLVTAPMTSATAIVAAEAGSFPGNLAAFTRERVVHGPDGAELILSASDDGGRPYRSGAFASARSFTHGRFQAEIRAARGPGLVTGFFLHRHGPRQEIDIELTGDDPSRMLTNVYFNPGDEGAGLSYGYRGAPCRIELGFDAAEDFHLYTIDWRPGCISWSVDDVLVHQRRSWEPTPVPHLPMRLHGNLWAPRSNELAGRIDKCALPSSAGFRNLAIWI